MHKNNASFQKGKQGFTLIEILVVIGMIALLATIVLIAINPARQFRQGRDTKRTSNVNAILNAIGQYTADNKGNLPSAITTTKTEIKKTSGIDICEILVPKYLPALPIDPTSGTDPKTDKDDDQISYNTTAANNECAGGYATGYSVVKDVNGRVTVSANGEEPSGTDNITITR